MDKLPQEVLDRIAGYVFPRLASGGKYSLLEDRPGPAECATISRTWKRTIEAMTFRRLGVLSRDDIPDTKYLLDSNPHRRASVERIDFLIKVDDTPRDTQFHRMRDQKLVQEFRLLINFINEIWPTSNDHVDNTQPILLVVSIFGYSKWDALLCDQSGFTQEPGTLNQLPSCPAVTSLAIYFEEALRSNFHPRDEAFAPMKTREADIAMENGTKVPPAWIMNVLAKFPSAQQVDYEIYNFIRRGLRRYRMQQELCNALGGPALAHLQNLSLWFGPNNFSSTRLQAFLSNKQYPAVPPVRPTDSLNSVLRTLSQQLKELHLNGLFSLSPDLFINRADDNNQPSWPRLRVLRVTTTLLTPCGSKWLIPLHRFRPRENRPFTINATLNAGTTEFNKLMTALSHGMLAMPRLQLLTLDFLVGPAEPNWEDEDVNWPGQTYELVRYVREENESREMVQWRGGIREKPAEGNRFCTLAVFNERFISTNKVLYWRPFPKEAVQHWNELHKRIKGLSGLEEWRRM
ncbi:hypothetical protein N0V85_008820 [Neurospora sp. IMI 360204]|nr:hypothetical protein N0V85_008820 [Neurospora sp. IMI 360204]